MSRSLPILSGVAMTVAVHGVLGASYAVWSANYETPPIKVGEAPQAPVREAVLCDGMRCPKVERRRRRRPPEPPPVKDLDVLEAAMIPALGGVAPEPKQLPEIVAYQEPERVEDGVNLANDEAKPKELIKEVDPKPQKKPAPKSLDALLKDYRNDDPRARRKKLENIIGDSDGEVGGQATQKRLGSVYSARASRVIRRVFKTPPFIDASTLKTLRTRVLVTRIGLDGAVLKYRVVRKSKDKSFNDAALAAIKQFVPSEGGTRRLPPPDPDVLSYINAKGLSINFDGRYARR